jgi:hypothetical protein
MPSKEDGGALKRETDDFSTPAQDYAVTSGQRDRSPPSPSVLCGHPRRPNTISSTASPSPTLWGTGRQDTTTPTVVPRMASRQRRPRISARATAEWTTPALPPSKPLLDGHRARHDVPPEARFARTAVYSVALYTMPPHIDKIVWHDVNYLLLAYQRRGSPQATGG